MNGKKTLVPVVVCCRQSDGVPALFGVTPQVSEEQVNNGDHYELAIENAQENGYEGAFLAFDFSDAAALQLDEMATWARCCRVQELALKALSLDGMEVCTQDSAAHPLAPKAWLLKTKSSAEFPVEVCVSQGEAADKFARRFYAPLQGWMTSVERHGYRHGFENWVEEQLRECIKSFEQRAQTGNGATL